MSKQASSLHQQHLSSGAERWGCGTSELMASERESATARAHCGVHLRVTGIASTHPRSLRRWRTRRCRVCRSIVGYHMTHRTWACPSASRGDGPIRCHIRPCAPDWYCDRILSKGDTCLTRARRGRDARDSARGPTRRRDERLWPRDRAATLTALAKKSSDGKLLPMRYISSSSASMHLRCRLMTSRKKA